MNTKKLFSTIFLALSLFVAGQSKAAFPVKKAVAIEAVSTVSESPSLTTSTELVVSVPTEVTYTKIKKHSFFNRIAHKLAEKAAVSQAAYIILSIFWLGWLAIGLNDDFEGSSWLLALLLYILFYFPGLIYSLIVMGDYY